MAEIACPQCKQKMKVFLIESQYQGPLRCSWCRRLFMVTIREGKLESSRLITEEELKAAQEIEALKAKFRKDSASSEED